MKPTGFLIMGVSGSGKTTLGKALAQRLGWKFVEGDDYHPPENIAKMKAGIPLNDFDRAPWLAALRDRVVSILEAGHHPVLASSALKEKYRAQLLEGLDGIAIIHLKGDYDLIWSRMSLREGHYMKPEMLESQFEALEEPGNAIILDAKMPVEEMVNTIIREGF